MYLSGFEVIDRSVVERGGTLFFLARDAARGEKVLCVRGDSRSFDGTPHATDAVLLCPLNAANAAALRGRLDWLNPAPLGTQTSAGFGDRLGLATPGHVAALAGTGIAPVFAQQSVRENARTGRSPQDVLDDAMWGVFQAGWRAAWGADADHLKTPDVLAPFVTAGYSFFTVDPGEHVDSAAQTDPLATLRAKVGALPWHALSSTRDALLAAYAERVFALEGHTARFDELSLLRAAAKYGRAVAHIAGMYRELRALMNGRPFDFEVSVDETDTPTTMLEHIYIASELTRLDVTWVSMAPRFVGRFEKGVDFIGDLAALETNLAQHAAVMRHFGGYKLSLHSGSDKFSVYPLAARHTRGLVHLKTAGTSYLEALRVAAEIDPGFFRAVLTLAIERYATDRATYHVSGDATAIAPPDRIADDALPALLDNFDARQVLHVTYGSVLDAYGEQLGTLLAAHDTRYAAVLEAHFKRHLEPFRAA